MYWSTNEPEIRMDQIAKIIPTNRFCEIKCFLHFANNLNVPNSNDKYWKIRSVLVILYKTFHNCTSPTENVPTDEIMVSLKVKAI